MAMRYKIFQFINKAEFPSHMESWFLHVCLFKKGTVVVETNPGIVR